MKKIIILLFIFSSLQFGSASPIFRQVEDLEDANIRRVAISSLKPSLIYLASKNSLYKSNDRGKTFKKVCVFKDEKASHIFFDPYLAATLYIATTRHLYKFKDKLERLFTAAEEELIYAAAVYRGRFYVGTSKGIYSASGETLNWQKLKNFDQFSVYYIETAGDNLYLATSKGIYLFKESGRSERVFVLRDPGGGEESNLAPNVIKADIFDDEKVWLGTTRGLFFSTDKGRSWRKLYIKGVDNLSVRSIAETGLEKNTLYLGSTKGLFRINLKKKDARQIYEGLPTDQINWLKFSSRGEIYLATPRGLFKSEYFTPSSPRSKWEEVLENEPDIGEVQEAALRYNEVHPRKVRRWRKALKYRAFLPSFNLDYDKTVNYDSGSDRYYVGPRDWGVSFSWDLSNLVWNNYEDDVDTRSRLNTQLRLDILDEINRVYFERLRLKEKLNSPSLSKEELFQKKLRLKELTAVLNGYTGGYLSRWIKHANETR